MTETVQQQKNSRTSFIQHLIKRNTNIVGAIVWLLILLGALFAFGCHVYYLISRYNEFPVSNVLRHQKSQFLWPDITICPTGRLDEDRLKAAEMLNTHSMNEWNWTFGNYTSFWKRFLKTIKPPHKHDENDIKNLALINMYLNEDENNLGFKQVQDTIFYCRFQESGCTFINFTTHKHPILFNCFTFRPWSRLVKLPGKSHGLDLMLHLGGSNQAWVPTEQYLYRFRGFRIALHGPHTLPDFNSNALDVEVGTRVDLEITAKRLTRINRTASPCFDQVRVWDNTYTETSAYCKERALQRYYWLTCGCLSPDLHRTPDAVSNIAKESSFITCLDNKLIRKALHYDVPKLAEQLLLHFQYKCYKQTLSNLSKLIESVQCPTKCVQEDYHMHTSFSTWPEISLHARNVIQHSIFRNLGLAKHYYMDFQTLMYWNIEYTKLFVQDRKKKQNKELYLLNSPKLSKAQNSRLFDLKSTASKRETERVNFIRSRFAILKFFVSSTTIDVSEEQASYPSWSLLSDIGGSMGMWVGFSFITVVELVETIVAWSMSRWQTHKNEEESSSIAKLSNYGTTSIE